MKTTINGKNVYLKPRGYKIVKLKIIIKKENIE